MKLKWIALSLLLFVLLGTAMAQSDRASITGTVHDSSNAVVPGVQVTVTNIETNYKTTATTNSLGLYSILNLPIGEYSLKFTKDGFSTYERHGITLQVSQIAEISPILKVGTTSETVTVTENAPMLQTQTAAMTTNLTNEVVSELPLNVRGGRSLSSFMFAYVPGIEGSDYDSHINGSVSKSKEVMIDGTSAIAQIGGYISESQPPMEAIEEFQATSSGIRADEGRSGGGVFRYNMKSGTNGWHGSAFGFLQNEALNANSWNNKYHQIVDVAAESDPTRKQFLNSLYSRPKDELKDYGGSFGGAIRKDKTFFYTAYERYTFQNYGLGGMGSTVPTAAFLNGDFSALLGAPLLNNGNPVLDGAGNVVRSGAIVDPTTGNVFVGNIIPQARFSAVSQKIVDIYKQQYAPLADGFVRNNAMPASQPAPWLHQNLYSVKLDHIVSDKQRMAASFIYAQIPRVLADQGGVWAPGSTDGGPLANAYNHTTNAPSVRFSDTYTFTPSLLNVVNFTLNRFHNPSTAVSQAGNWSKTLGIGDFGAGNFPIIKFQGVNSDQHRYIGGEAVDESQLGSQFNDFYTANTFIYSDNLSWVKGRHIYKFGAEFRAQQFNSHGDYGVPTITFDPAQTAGNWGGGFGFASFLLGQANQGSVSVPNNTYGRRKSLSLYAQDDIKVTDKLTLNADLRWDFNGRYHEKFGRWSNFNTTAINPVTGLPGVLEFAKDGSDSFERKQNYHNFSGHLGAAFAVTPKTVLRASFGVFYVPLNLNTWGGIPYGFNPGFAPNNQVTTPFNWDNGYQGTPVDIGKNPNFTKWGMVTIDPRALTLGNQQQWTVGVQREITKDFLLDVSFIQSHSYHLESGAVAGNQPKLADYTAGMTAMYAAGGQPWMWVDSPASAAAAGVTLPFPGFAGPAYAAAGHFPFPTVAATWGPLFGVGAPLGNADYQSLQFSLSKRASHGLSFQASYNLSSAHGDVDNSFQELWGAGPLQDLYNLETERHTISPFDQKHIVKGYITYELPFGKGKALLNGAGPALNSIVGGWMITSGFHYSSGTPMRVTANGWYPGMNNVYSNLDPTCDLKINPDAGVGQQYFNPACFSNPTGMTFGNAPGYLSQLRNPGLATEDIGLTKALSFGSDGRYKLSLRAQVFNAFNRHGFGSPNTAIGGSDFGKITAATLNGSPGPRQGQLGARFTF